MAFKACKHAEDGPKEKERFGKGKPAFSRVMFMNCETVVAMSATVRWAAKAVAVVSAAAGDGGGGDRWHCWQRWRSAEATAAKQRGPGGAGG